MIFVALYLLVRLMGKRELGQMAAVRLIVLVVIGDLTQQGVTQNDFSLTGVVIATVTIAFLGRGAELGQLFWPRAERLLEGEPRVIVRDGELLTDNLRRGLTVGEIESEMRLAGTPHQRVAGRSSSLAARSASSSAPESSPSGEEPPPQPKGAEDEAPSSIGLAMRSRWTDELAFAT